MATTITMPQLGETVTEGTVAQWLKKPGDSVEKYEAFVEVSTDKVNADVPSPVTGTIRELLVKEGETVPTGTPIAVIDEVGAAAAPRPERAPHGSAAPAAIAGNHMASDEPVPGNGFAPRTARRRRRRATAHSGSGGNGNAPTARRRTALRVSPAVRRLAREHSVDIRAVTRHRRQRPRHRRRHAGRGAAGPGRCRTITPTTRVHARARRRRGRRRRPAAPGRRPRRRPRRRDRQADVAARSRATIPLTQARRIIAEAHGRVQAHRAARVDDGRSRRHQRLEVALAREGPLRARDYGIKLTLLPFFIRAVVESLARVPADERQVHRRRHLASTSDVNIGIAIGPATNLVVPVIRNADQLSIKGLALAAGELIDKARARQTRRRRSGRRHVHRQQQRRQRLDPLGADHRAGPSRHRHDGSGRQAAGRARRRRDRDPLDDELCLSLDHRVVDGYVASGFLADLKKRLEAMGPSGAL